MKGSCEPVISTEPCALGQAKSQALALVPSGKCQDQNPGDDAKKHSDGQRLSCLALAMMSGCQQGAQGNHQEKLGGVGQFLKQFNPVAGCVQAFPLALFDVLPEFK